MRLVAIGDVGVVDGMMHIGDEAMFAALVDELGSRGADDITALSAAPQDTTDRYGVAGISRIGFRGSRDEMEQRLAAVRACASGAHALADDDPVWAVIDAVADADGVVIAGGGNLASTWPLHIYERAALAAIAERFGRPLVITGQTLGPALEGADRELAGALLRSAGLVGLREAASAQLAAELGVRDAHAATNRDDASFLGIDEPEAADPASHPYVLVSLSTHLGGRPRDAIVSGIAGALDGLADETGLPVRFHAHFGSLRPDYSRGDTAVHDAVRAAMRTASESAPVGDPRSAARLARGAAFLLTSRYHPAVFATPAGVPVLALSADEYTGVKLSGALGHWGQNGVVDLDAVLDGTVPGEVHDVWTTRARIRSDTAGAIDAARAAAAAWWDRVADTLASVG